MDKIKEYLDDLWPFARSVGKHYVDDSCQTTAAALTYQTLFAVVPLLTVMYTMLSAFNAFSDMGKRVEDLIFQNIVPANVHAVQEYLHRFSDQARDLSVWSVIILAVTAFLMLFTIERTFNQIWGVREPRQGFQRFMMYWAVLTMGPLLVVVGIGTTTYVFSLPLVSDVTESPFFLRFLPLITSAVTFTLIYTVVPNTMVPLRHALVGGVVVAVVFETAKFSFGFVMTQTSFEAIYGTFAVVPGFLIWIYVSWTIVLAGAEVVKALGVYRFDGSHKLEDPLFQILIILDMFYRAHQEGRIVSEKEIRNMGSRIHLENWQDYRQRLVDLNLIRSVEKGGLVLARDLSEISLWQLYKQLPWPLPAKTVEGSREWERSLSEVFERISGRNQEILGINLEAVFRGDGVPRA